MTSPTERDARRVKVAILAHGGASARAIAAELGVSKDTVLRDLEAGAPPAAIRRIERAARIERTESLLRQLETAVASVRADEPWLAVVSDLTAAYWRQRLRTAAEALAAADAEFDLYYPDPSSDQPEQVLQNQQNTPKTTPQTG